MGPKRMGGWEDGITRREFLACSALTAAAVGAGCAVNPVTGRQQLMVVSEDQELAIDRQSSPHQFSSDYGPVQDRALAAYVDGVGRRIAPLTHRPAMPYRFVPVNAVYVNAYAFPAGSIGITRGILLNLESEAALASLLGHEMGHVNARHTAAQMSTGLLTSLVLAGASAYVGSVTGYGGIASDLGQIAGGALLASYSRDNEREADRLGLQYMTAAGYGPQGQVQLMDMLRSLHDRQPSALELMFATHPMSEERYRTVLEGTAAMPPSVRDLPLHRERYMDSTVSLRAQREAIEGFQKGERAMGGKKYGEAEGHFSSALARGPEDYAGLLLMAKCQYAQKKFDDMDRYAERARAVYPEEAQACHVSGMAKLLRSRYDEAYDEFDRCDRLLPGNPNLTFFKGLCREKSGRRQEAAVHYRAYLQRVSQGEYARYARARLSEWGELR